MTLIDRLRDALPEISQWRRHIHAHPETAFEEFKTSDFVAERLASFGIKEIHRGIAGTGVVAVLRNGEGPSIGLRADMDALHLEEHTNLPYRSTHAGRMHACGHDGHTTMLLAAARHLAETKNFKGTVVLIFQPAEENEGGGRRMIEEGLFDSFPVDSVYGMHNWPGLELGKFAVKAGPMLAAYDVFEATVQGKGCHGAMPHFGVDPIVTAAQIINAWQTIPSRNVSPLDSAVVSVTQIHAGETWNVIPDSVIMRGTVRTFEPQTQDFIERRMAEIGRGLCAAAGAEFSFRFERRYPATINSEKETELAARAAVQVVGEANVVRDPTPSMGGEDFAFMLQKKPGCYIFVGNGAENSWPLHSPHYDFNDQAIPYGASYWVRLVETLLPA